MSTRKRSSKLKTTNGAPAPPALSANGGAPIDPTHLPPDRPRKKALQPVTKPLHNISFTRVIYALSAAALLLLAFYTWRLTVLKSEAGGWWNLALGRRPPGAGAGASVPVTGAGGSAGAGGVGGKGVDRNDVALRLSDLASAMGIQPPVLASALASVLEANIPPATLSSISSSAAAALQTKGSSDEDVVVLDALLGGAVTANDPGTVQQVAGGVKGAFDTVVGFDEPTELT